MERFLTQSFLALERMLWCVVLASGFVALLQRDDPSLRERLQREVLYHERKFKIPACRLARGLQSVAMHHLGTPMLNNA